MARELFDTIYLTDEERQQIKDLDAAGVIIENIGGLCPVQADAIYKGRAIYFRARGNRWSLGWAHNHNPMDAVCDDVAWYHEQEYGEHEGDAGHMTIHEALGYIRACITQIEQGK